MKLVKGIGLFVVYPLVMLGIGFAAGVWVMDYFYPGKMQMNVVQESDVRQDVADSTGSRVKENEESVSHDWTGDLSAAMQGELQGGQGQEALPGVSDSASDVTDYMTVSGLPETLSVDTDYVLQENDLTDDTVVETVLRLPDKYFGMDREQFLEAMELYEAFPPLAEMERGFVGLEVLSFSAERVVVQMNYRYVEPSKSFYLAVKNNEVVVYLEDGETVYINTGIWLDNLPEDVQLDVIQMLWVEDEEELFDFLESYSS